MNISRLALSLTCTLFLSFSTSAQLTADYFSIEGLTFGSLSQDDTWNVYLGGYSFYSREENGDTSTIYFSHNTTIGALGIQVVGHKVFHGSVLHYDFGAEIGDTIIEGYYKGAVVTDTYFYTLLNGQQRRALDLSLEIEMNGELEQFNFTWVDGIGDLRIGLFPYWPIGFHLGSDALGCIKIFSETLLLVNESICDAHSCPFPYTAYDFVPNDLAVEFENKSINSTEYLWDFGDGNSSTEENPIHEYDTPGCYEVTLSTKSYCSNSYVTKTNTISVCKEGPWFSKPTPISNTYKRVRHFGKNQIFIWSQDSLFRTTTQGDSWELSVLPLLSDSFDLEIIKIQMFDKFNGILLVEIESNSNDQDKIYSTNDGGLTWTESNFLGNHSYSAVMFENGKALLDGALDQMYRTDDFGLNWSALTVPANYNILEIHADTESFLYAQINIQEGSNAANWIGFSENFGVTWNLSPVPDYITQISMIKDSIWYGMEPYFGQNLYKSLDQGETWEIVLPNKISQLVMINEKEGWCVISPYELIYTTDGFETYASTKCNSASRWISSNESNSGASVDSKFFYYFDPDKAHTCLDSDIDGDGYFDNVDCDDTNVSVNPGAIEVPYNGLDDDCDPMTLDDDLDQDGFLMIDDCDDLDPLINPLATEIPNNGIDENCDDLDYITSIENQFSYHLKIYPNPAIDVVSIEISENGNYKMTLKNSLGELLYQQQFDQFMNLDISNFENGILIIEIEDLKNGNKVVEQIIHIK